MIIALGMCVAAGSSTRGDQIVIGVTTHNDAKITTLEQGKLRFRAADGQLKSEWIGDVGRLIVDRTGAFADFNEAEKYLAGNDPEQAILRYRRALRVSEDFWPDLIASRLFMACDRAGRIEDAVLNFIRIVRGRATGPPAAARLFPTKFSKTRDAATVAAIGHLDAAITEDPLYDQKTILELFRYQFLRELGDPRTELLAGIVAGRTIPESIRCSSVFEIQLHAFEEAFERSTNATTIPSLDRAIRDCPESSLPGFLLFKGGLLTRQATTREDWARAAWPFVRVIAHMPDDPAAADGLLGAAHVLDRLGRSDKALELLRECLTHKNVRPETRTAAEYLLNQMQTATGVTPTP